MRMPLRTGKWKINSNGFVGELAIDSVDVGGNLSGTVLIDEPRFDEIRGFWDELSQKIMFQRIINPDDPSSIQTYTGFLFEDPLRISGVGGYTAFTLAGYFEAFSGGGGFAKRALFAWYAQIGLMA
jgi:hypothetical protein